MKKRKQRNRKPDLTLMNLKVSAADRRALNAAAQRYMGGNLSAWLRFAGMTFKPKNPQIR